MAKRPHPPRKYWDAVNCGGLQIAGGGILSVRTGWGGGVGGEGGIVEACDGVHAWEGRITRMIVCEEMTGTMERLA